MRVVFLNTKARTDLRDDFAEVAIKEGRAVKEEDYVEPAKRGPKPKQEKEEKQPVETKELKVTKKTK